MGLFSKKTKKAVTYFNMSAVPVNSAPVVFYDYNAADYIQKGYTSNSDVYSIVNKITDKAAVATPYIYIDNGAVKAKKEIKTKFDAAKHRIYISKALTYADDNKDLAKLLKNPNEYQTWRELITLFRIFYHVQGEAFMYREAGDDGCALSIHIAPAQYMTAIVDNDKLVGWQMDFMNGTKKVFYGETAEDIMHFKMPNPTYTDGKSIRGMSPLMAGLKYLQLNDSGVTAWIRSIENEGAKGIVSPNHPNPDMWLTPDQVKMTQDSIENKIHGTTNRNKIAVSGMPLQYTNIGLSPDALNIVKGLEHSSAKLCDLWGVPPVLFDPNPTYENQKSANDRFVREVILPYLSAEEDKLNSWLVEPFSKRDKKRYVLDYDLSSYEELRIASTDVEALLKTHTINEVRIMQGSDELQEDYANQVFIAQGLVPLSDYTVDISV